ncbi:MAG: hypothetical protein GEV06_23735 [Luteitalea sp.]|nr:hypothetical protein [Luteitalea sp.]
MRHGKRSHHAWLDTATACVGIVLFSIVTLRAQFDTGQISGFVRDSEGLVTPGASVTATNEGTGQQSVAVSNDGWSRPTGSTSGGRWEVFNVLNHQTLGSANSNPTSGSFGPVTSKTGNRTMQVVLQYGF